MRPTKFILSFVLLAAIMLFIPSAAKADIAGIDDVATNSLSDSSFSVTPAPEPTGIALAVSIGCSVLMRRPTRVVRE